MSATPGTRLALCAAIVGAAGAVVVQAALARPDGGLGTRLQGSPVTIIGAVVQGRVVKLSLRVRGWRTGARVRIFVDGRYNNFSTGPGAALALNLPAGKHKLSADLVAKLGGRPSIRSSPRQIRIASSADPVLAAAGDIACDPADPSFNGGRGTATACHAAATAQLIAAARPSLVLPLGDEQYECGGPGAFAASYARSWGRFVPISRPIPGNHEYAAEGTLPFAPTCDSTTPGAGYFSYFGPGVAGPGGYYSYDVAGWHVIALNSECAYIGGCGGGSPEELWLRADLAAHPSTCTLAYWHRPRWTGTAAGAGDDTFDALWRDLYTAHAEVVLNGHRHLYIRLTPLNGDGAPDAAGIREIVVGTGGQRLFGQGFATIVESHEQSEYGVLLLTLHPASYEWQFEPELGSLFTDYGTGACH